MGIGFKQYLSTRVAVISNILNIPRITVERVIKEYLEGLIRSALKGETIVIDNIVSIRIYAAQNGELIVRSRISSSLKNKLKDVNLTGIELAKDIDLDTEDSSVA